MKYQLLGPLRVVDETGTSCVRAKKVEVLLATLLVRADRLVTPDRLMAEIWGERLPGRATAGLHVYISDVRKFLHRPDRPQSPIVTNSPGYMLRRLGAELDHETFLDLTEQGREHLRAQRFAEAAARLETALGLWRGPVLNNIGTGPILRGFSTWLAEVRLECVEMLVDCRLQLGQHRELVGELYLLTAEHPLREAFYRQLMLALYRAERRAEALQVYQTARRTLVDELGLEPCPALRELQRAILDADGRVLEICAAAV